MKKKSTRWLSIFMMVILSFSCDESETQLSLQGSTYYHSFVSTREECTERLITFGVNCFQSIEFIDNETAFVVVTDIVTRASYCTLDDLIIVTVKENADFFEAENPMFFVANQDLSELTRVSANNQAWESSLPWSE